MVVSQAHNHKRYIVVAVLASMLEGQTLVDYGLGNLAVLKALGTQFKYALYYVLLRV